MMPIDETRLPNATTTPQVVNQTFTNLPPPLPAVVDIVDHTVFAAESGSTTSEFKVLVGSAGTLFTALVGVYSAAGGHVSPEQLDALTKLGAALAAVSSAYIVSRGVRKAGTPG